MSPNKFPAGWDEKKVRRVLAHYEEQSEEDAVLEDEAGVEPSPTVMKVPLHLVPKVREMIGVFYHTRHQVGDDLPKMPASERAASQAGSDLRDHKTPKRDAGPVAADLSDAKHTKKRATNKRTTKK
jgi:hypothetical protein